MDNTEAVEKLADIIVKDGSSALTLYGAAVVAEIALAAIQSDPAAFGIKPRELVWDKHPDEQEWYCKFPEIDNVERGYMILYQSSYGGFVLYDGFSSRRRKINLCHTFEAADAAANEHLRNFVKELF